MSMSKDLDDFEVMRDGSILMLRARGFTLKRLSQGFGISQNRITYALKREYSREWQQVQIASLATSLRHWSES